MLSVLTVNTLADNTSDTGVLTLRDAITLVNNGGNPTSLGQPTMPTGWAAQIDNSAGGFGTNDTIQFASSLLGPSQQTITLGGSELLVSRSVSIIGPGASLLAINGNGQSRVFEFASGTTDSISGLTIENGSAPALMYEAGSGGGILNLGTLTVTGCTLAGNHADYADGGGIYAAQTITGCTLIDNHAYSNGGGIYGGWTITGCTLIGNTASIGGGGGIGGAGTITDCTLVDNIAGGSGGGILGGVLTGCTLIGNTASIGGGDFGGFLTDCTLMDNSAAQGGGYVPIFPGTNLTGCTISGNSADDGAGGGIYSPDVTRFIFLSGCTVTDNSSTEPGGGISHGPTLTIRGDSASDLYGMAGPDINSTVYGNHDSDSTDPGGTMADLAGIVNVYNAVVPHYGPGVTITVAGTDTATVLTSSVVPNYPSQEALNATVLAAYAGAPTPTGTVTFYDGNNVPLGSGSPQNLDANGQATLYVSLATPGPIHAVFSGNGYFAGSGSTSAPVVQAVVDAQSKYDLEKVINTLAAGLGSDAVSTGVQVTLDPNAFYGSTPQQVASAIAQITAPAGLRVAITYNPPQGTYPDLTLSTQTDVSLVVNFASGSQVVGHSPALTVTGGDITVANAAFTTATNAPTILVTSGHLALRNDVVQSSIGYNAPAIAISGGSTLDLGSPASPGGNTINVNAGGTSIQSTGTNVVLSSGNTFQANGSPVSSPFATVGLASSASTSVLNQPVTFTATVSPPSTGAASPSGNVTFVDATTGTTLGVVALSGGTAQLTIGVPGAGAQTIAAVYSGDGHYITSAVTVVQQVTYHFGGFLAPLSTGLSYAVGRTVPIKFQLTDYNSQYVTSLSAIVSLQVLNAQGTNVLMNAGSTALRYDPTANQFVANWQTKGLAAGKYTVTLSLADGTVQTKTITLSANGASAGLMADGTAAGQATAGALQGGDVALYVDNSSGLLTTDELARIDDAVAAVAAVLARYGVTVTETTDSTSANVVLDTNTTTAVGSAADGVLGCETPGSDSTEITLVQGWDWYAGADPTAIQAGQFDFETVVMHELGHALGLGHSVDPTSVMYATLATGMANRNLTVADLNVPDGDGGGSSGLHARVLRPALPPAPIAAPPSWNQNVGLMAWDLAVADLYGTGLSRTLRKRT